MSRVKQNGYDARPVDGLAIELGLRLRSFSLELALSIGRETVALVGPSGAGKTTVLRSVAGLCRPDRGRITLGGRTWFDGAAGFDLAPELRSVGLVFQEYALFPHMTVRANVAFGGGRDARRDRESGRVAELLERLRIAELANERPAELSGGERQRVALARALARDPSVLLLDEPLSALDAHTRALVRGELADLLGQLRLPALLVTHDFRDAAALADRVGVVVDGTLRQLGTPAELVARPADTFVVSLTGGNLLPGTARPRRGGGSEVVLDTGGVVCSDEAASGRVGVVVYPWEVSLHAGGAASGAVNELAGPIASLTPDGGRLLARVGQLTAECDTDDVERLRLRRGELATARFSPGDARLIALDGALAAGAPV